MEGRSSKERKKGLGLSPVCLPIWRHQAGVDFLEKFRADIQYILDKASVANVLYDFFSFHKIKIGLIQK